MPHVLVEVRNLKKYFPVRGPFGRSKLMVHAVDDVSFNIEDGETLGLAGESGCGKTTLGRTILRLYEPTSGEAYFEGRNIFELGKEELRKLRREMQIIFQDPYSSLNPRMTVQAIIGEPLNVHGVVEKDEQEDKIIEMLKKVGLEPEHIRRYPHEFSGGQRQRIAIARALILNPKFIVADEPASALDVSVQASILNLMRDLQQEFGLTYLFVTHDLSVIRLMSDRVAIMYLGRIVELAPTDELFASPEHPYTQALLSAIPIPDPNVEMKPIFLKGDIPTPINPPSGCRLHPRCPYCKSMCEETEPELINVGGKHYVTCHMMAKK